MKECGEALFWRLRGMGWKKGDKGKDLANLQVARFLFSSLGLPNQYFRRPPDSQASRWLS
jgi:hypothetical protein